MLVRCRVPSDRPTYGNPSEAHAGCCQVGWQVQVGVVSHRLLKSFLLHRAHHQQTHHNWHHHHHHHLVHCQNMLYLGSVSTCCTFPVCNTPCASLYMCTACRRPQGMVLDSAYSI